MSVLNTIDSSLMKAAAQTGVALQYENPITRGWEAAQSDEAREHAEQYNERKRKEASDYVLSLFAE